MVTVEEGNPETFWTDWDYPDPSWFSRRIRVAAWALFRLGCFGVYDISHQTGVLIIRRVSGARG